VTIVGVSRAASHRLRREAGLASAVNNVVALCAVGAVAILAAACSCDDMDDPWRATYVSTAEAAVANGTAASPAVPGCEVEKAAAAETRAASGAAVNPDLLEIARLEIERDCYKEAEKTLRKQLDSEQPATTGIK
jgi:hypothetical protein